MSPPISRDALNELKSRQAAFLKNRLVSPKAKEEWRTIIEQAYASLLARRLGELTSPAALSSLVESALAQVTAAHATSNVFKQIESFMRAELRANSSHVGVYVPDSARKLIDTFLERPKLVPEGLIRKIFEQDAMEEAMRDVLFDTLKTFNDSVNPFFADWGLPALIKRFLPIGSGAVLKSMEAVRGEFDKRLEPEIRKFLKGFSRKALKKMADFIVASSDEPKAIGVRKSLASWLYEQEVKNIVANADDAGLALSRQIGAEIASHITGMDSTKKRQSALIEAFFALHKKHTLAQVLAHYEITSSPDFDVIADVSWPAVKAVLESDSVSAWTLSLISEFFDSFETS